MKAAPVQESVRAFANTTSGGMASRRLGELALLTGTPSPTVSVVIPAKNESANLAQVLNAIPHNQWEVILVDGHSSDDTVAVARGLRTDIIVLSQTGTGKGNALACGFLAASGDIVVMIDADASMDPREIPAFVDAVAAAPGTYAKGSRLVAPGGSDDLTLIRRAGNRVLLALVNALFRTKYTDLCYGFIAFWRSDLGHLGFECSEAEGIPEHHRNLGFEVETYMNIRAAREGLRIVEVPSFERERANGVSNLRVLRDGLRVVLTIASERVRRSPKSTVGPVDERRLADLLADAGVGAQVQSLRGYERR